MREVWILDIDWVGDHCFDFYIHLFIYSMNERTKGLGWAGLGWVDRI